MSLSLYRKYRPARFEDIVGQEHVARTLVNAVTSDRVSHAYLFAGPRGTGKTSTAKILAMALNCDAGQGRATPTPDGTCPHCEAIRRGSALDVVEMDAASTRKVEEITELLIDKVHFSPLQMRAKVYILDEVHMLTDHAFNALLKTLEEPPVHAVFVLATTEPHKVPATILSRCQRFDFRRPSITEVVSVLATIAAQENIEVAEASLIVIAREAAGSFRDAIGILDQLSTYSGGKVTLQETLDILGIVKHDLLLEIVDLVHERDTKGALLFVESLSLGATDYTQFMKDLLGHLRDVYVVKHTEEPPASIALTDEQLGMLRSQASRVSTARTVAFIDLLGEGLRAVRQGSDARLELELALIKMTASVPAGTAAAQAATDPALASASQTARGALGAETRAAQPMAGKPAVISASPEPVATQPAPAARPAPASPEPAATQPTPATVQTTPATVQPDIDHLRRAWPLVLEAVKKRQAGLSAVLGEGRPDSLEGDELAVKFPAGYSFQANQVVRGDNPQVIADALREVTGRELRVITRMAVEAAPQSVPEEEDARILNRDELIRVLKQEFDARVVDDEPVL